MNIKYSFFHRLRRPEIGSITLSIVVALYLVLFMNRTFWSKVFIYFHNDIFVISVFAIMLTAVFMVLTIAFSVKYLIKPIFIFLILVASTASWFTDRFGAVINVEMIRNVMETTTAEARGLITFSFIFHLFCTGIIPSFLIAAVRIRHRNWRLKAVCNLAVIIPLLAVVIVAGMSISRQLISTVREHSDIRRLINPAVPITSAVKYVLANTGSQPVVITPLGLDAKVHNASDAARIPRVLIVVAGETARAANFSLGGYMRQTNPGLARRNVLYFGNTTSCGTATAQSIPCMFSVFSRKEFSHEKGRSTETLPDVLEHAGIYVEWWENNTGSKGVADRVKTVEFYGSSIPGFCNGGECQDGIMLEKIGPWLDGVKSDSVLFIHQIGSHGPAYFRRYPEKFRRFRPDCREIEFSTCSLEEIRNAYDNSILYTDYFLSRLIDALAARSRNMDAAMVYMSDHGESLGENGIYLHGAPYMFAPVEQTHIPFVLWMAPGFARSAGIDRACLEKAAAFVPLSHDNLFPSVLSMMNVDTSIRDDNLNLFAQCTYGHAADRDNIKNENSALAGGATDQTGIYSGKN